MARRPYKLSQYEKNPNPKGPRLVDYALWLVREHKLTNHQVAERWGVNRAWLHCQESGRSATTSCDVIQNIIEDLTGKSIVDALEEARK
jgi:hypothetical protein